MLSINCIAEINYIVDFKSHIRYFCVSVKHITILLYVGQAHLRYFYRSVKRAAEELAAHFTGDLFVRYVASSHIADIEPVDEGEVQCAETSAETLLEPGSVGHCEPDLFF